jgi:two-component system response regulator FixJ
MNSNPTVFVVDDDAAVRDSVGELVRSVGISARLFASAQEFLDAYDPNAPGCLVLDLRLPGMSGLELHRELVGRGIETPTIFLTAYADIPTAVNALQQGAVDFVEKPFRGQPLLDSINRAIALDAELRRHRAERAAVTALLDTLTDRERELLDWVIEGFTNKVIAQKLGISQKTVEQHRGRIMRKMKVGSLAELVRLVSSYRGDGLRSPGIRKPKVAPSGSATEPPIGKMA